MKYLYFLFLLFFFNSAHAHDVKHGFTDHGFVDHGIAAPVSEGRGLIAALLGGEPMILTVAQDRYEGRYRNSLLIINAKTGATQQFWYPKKDMPNGENYASLLASNGKFYTMFGDVFLEFDLEAKRWSFEQKIEGRVMSFAEDKGGVIYFANFPECTLYSFDPQMRQLQALGQLDAEEKYPFSLAVGKSEWLYAGIGTARNNIVAFNLKTRQRTKLIEESRRQLGEGFVFKATDGAVYARALKKDSALLKLENGRATAWTSPVAPEAAKTGAVFWQHRMTDFPGGGKISRFVLQDKSAVIEDANGNPRTIEFDYETKGAGVSALFLGPDGAIWGSTSHPLRLWRFDAAQKAFTDWDGLAEVFGGNLPNSAIVGKKIFGAFYNGGIVRRFDTSRPWTPSGDANPNPYQIGKIDEIARPRAATATLDNKTVIFGGFPGYGKTGGDLVFVDVATEKADIVKVQDVLPGQSTIALTALPNGILVGGTSTEAPGGGKKIAEKAVLYLMDGKSRKVLFQTVPVPSGADIRSLTSGPDGLIYGITADSQLFAFDVRERKIVKRISLEEFGAPINYGPSFQRDGKGRLYLLLSKSLLRIEANSTIAKLADFPENATAGLALSGGRIYYASGAKLWSSSVE